MLHSNQKPRQISQEAWYLCATLMAGREGIPDKESGTEVDVSMGFGGKKKDKCHMNNGVRQVGAEPAATVLRCHPQK